MTTQHEGSLEPSPNLPLLVSDEFDSATNARWLKVAYLDPVTLDAESPIALVHARFGYERTIGVRPTPNGGAQLLSEIEQDTLFVDEISAPDGRHLATPLLGELLRAARESSTGPITSGRMHIVNSRVIKAMQRLQEAGVIQTLYCRIISRSAPYEDVPTSAFATAQGTISDAAALQQLHESEQYYRDSGGTDDSQLIAVDCAFTF